jgi:hypothetical protein
MVSVVEALLLLLVRVALGELDELFPFQLTLELFLSPLFPNAIYDVWPPCIQEYASCIFNLFIKIGSFFLLAMSMLHLLLWSKLRHGFSVLKLIYHISMVVLWFVSPTHLPFVQAS